MLSWFGELSMSGPSIHLRIRVLPIQRMHLIRVEVVEAVVRVEQRLVHLVRCTMPCRDGKVKVAESDSHERETTQSLSSYTF